MFYESEKKNAIDLCTPKRNKEEQSSVDSETSKMALYHYEGCFFSGKVKKAIAILNLKIELRDIITNPEHGEALLNNGGRTTVPCLYLEETDQYSEKWMYESDDIIQYLKKRFE